MHIKRDFIVVLTAGALVCTTQAQPGSPLSTPPTNAAPKTDFSKIFKSDKEKLSYAIGMYWAAGVKSRLEGQNLDYDPDEMAKAFKDALEGHTIITDAQVREVLTELNSKIAAQREEKHKQQLEDMRKKGEENLTAGPAFLAKNKSAPGVKTLPSGLQYKIITDGSGPMPQIGDEATVNYRGRLIDQTEFDSSYRRNKPFSFRVGAGPGSVIKGWQEAAQLMKTGSKWEVYVPADLAYGTNTAGTIPPNSVLIFEIELLSVKSTTPPPAPSAPPPQAAATGPLTSDIIRVPSQEEMKKGAKIETIKQEDLEKLKTNSPPQ